MNRACTGLSVIYIQCRKMDYISSSGELSWTGNYLSKILSNGPVPNHVAFILDGNRRWARQKNLAVMQGHKFGLKSCHRVSSFLRAVGTKEITLYAFSIENFKRNKDEVENIMKMLDESFDDILNDKGCDFRIRLVGDITLLTPQLQQKVKEIIEMTKDYCNFTVNLAVAYTCRDDLTQSMRNILMSPTDSKNISVDLLDQKLYTGPCSKVDILVRTSGETRLSDFLLWEVGKNLC